MLGEDFIVSQIPEMGSKCGFIVGTFKAEKIFVHPEIHWAHWLMPGINLFFKRQVSRSSPRI